MFFYSTLTDLPVAKGILIRHSTAAHVHQDTPEVVVIFHIKLHFLQNQSYRGMTSQYHRYQLRPTPSRDSVIQLTLIHLVRAFILLVATI